MITVHFMNFARILDKIDKGKRINYLMGIEGECRKSYYSLFTDILRGSFELGSREYNPPSNELNALISFGNSLLYTTVLNQIYRTQLNPTVSYLHEPSEARFSLSLDISEVFKPLLVDKTIFDVVNNQKIDKSDFNQEVNKCLLNETGRKTFISEYEDRLSRTIEYDPLNREASYKTIIRYECYNLIKHLIEDSEYKSYRRGDM